MHLAYTLPHQPVLPWSHSKSHTAMRPRNTKSYMIVAPSLHTAPPTCPPLESQQEPQPSQHLARMTLKTSMVRIMNPPTICQAGTMVSHIFLETSSAISSGVCSGFQS